MYLVSDGKVLGKKEGTPFHPVRNLLDLWELVPVDESKLYKITLESVDNSLISLK